MAGRVVLGGLLGGTAATAYHLGPGLITDYAKAKALQASAARAQHSRPSVLAPCLALSRASNGSHYSQPQPTAAGRRGLHCSESAKPRGAPCITLQMNAVQPPACLLQGPASILQGLRGLLDQPGQPGTASSQPGQPSTAGSQHGQPSAGENSREIAQFYKLVRRWAHCARDQ